MIEYRNILCAVDFGDEAEIIIEKAADLAKKYAAKLSLVHVVEYIPIDFANELMLPQQQEIEEQLVVRAKESLSKLAANLVVAGVDTAVLVGSTKIEIIEFARSSSADLIIMGRHGRHGISRLLGSTANSVLHHAPCDVLAINLNR